VRLQQRKGEDNFLPEAAAATPLARRLSSTPLSPLAPTPTERRQREPHRPPVHREGGGGRRDGEAAPGRLQTQQVTPTASWKGEVEGGR